MDAEGNRDGGGRPMLVLAGLVDLALDTCGSALRTASGLLHRADVGELARQGGQDLRARGRLAVDRLPAGGPAHLEVLARSARSRSAGGSGG
ncbi:polyprenyl synthetase [Streptomyces sp. NPDC005899]|uniref:polyprenyl synthetase n=1 Tax=Streptomyces sp. NPDC005899 TaxID=3155716 RepID=UPI00340EF5C0